MGAAIAVDMYFDVTVHLEGSEGSCLVSTAIAKSGNCSDDSALETLESIWVPAALRSRLGRACGRHFGTFGVMD